MVLSSLTTVSVVPNLSSGFYLRCYLCRTSRCFQFLHCCLCQQSGLVKSLPAIRDFSTARSLLLSPLRSDQGVEPWEQQTEIKLLRIGARSVDASWVWLSASCVTVGKGGTEEEAASRQLYTAPTRPARSHKTHRDPKPGNSKSGSKTISAMNPTGSAKAMTYIQFSVEMYYLAGCQRQASTLAGKSRQGLKRALV